MQIAYFGNTLNKHQSNVADALYTLTKGQYIYVETVAPKEENKSGGKAKVERPYVLAAYKGEKELSEAKQLAIEADIALFGADSLLFEVVRMRQKNPKLSFEVSERWLKRGWINLFSPRLIKNLWFYHKYQYNKKPIYKLCSSAFAARDQYKLHTFKNKCYKWGYFTEVKEQAVEAPSCVSTSKSTTIIWCARFLRWKHPEMVIKLAQKLKKNGYTDVQIDLYGDGPERKATERLSRNIGVEEIVHFHGNVSNDEIYKEMKIHDIFLFTSDRNEGWGAVLNEAMSCNCAVVASDAIGSVPFLIKDGKNGMVFKSGKIESLYKKVAYLLDNPEDRKKMAYEGYYTLRDVWSPTNATKNLLALCDNLLGKPNSHVIIGPCSKVM